MSKLWDELTAPAQLAQQFLAWEGERFERHTIAEDFASARRVAAGLRKRGVRRGDLVPAVITNGPDATPGFAGIWLAGATIASLPIIARGMSIEGYVAQLDRLCKLLGASFLLAEERFLEFLPPDSGMSATPVGYRELIETPTLAPVEPPDPDRTVFVQFSSGTTGEPRGVELTGLAIEAQLETLRSRLAIDPARDVGYMWLPLSHDMGFFGCSLLAWYTGMRGVRSTPERFLQSPRSWFDDCAEFGATVTAGPPSALQLATRAERIRSSGAQLALRVCLIGAEQVDWDGLLAAAQTFAPRGLRSETLTVAYGLAEVTLAVTTGAVAEAPRCLCVDPQALADGRVVELASDERGRKVVSVGTPVAGTTVDVDPATGEVAVASTSLAAGYFGDADATAERFRGGVVRTRDLGFVRDGELFLTGRSDDLVIVGGRNVYVNDLEWEMGEDAAIRTGSCAIVDSAGDSGRMRIGIVAELRPGATDTDALARRLRRLAMERAGLPVDEVLFIDSGTFPKTPSGKVQRYRCRELVARSAQPRRT